jgi:hypothetical protein
MTAVRRAEMRGSMRRPRPAEAEAEAEAEEVFLSFVPTGVMA